MIQTTNNDIVIIGHGAFSGGDKNFKLPEHVELWMLQPIGTVMKAWLLEALIQGTKLDKLLYKPGKDRANSREWDDAHHMPRVYTKTAPDLILTPLGHEEGMVQGFIDGCKGKRNVPSRYKLAANSKPMRLSELLAIQDNNHLFRANVVSHLLTLGSEKRVRIYWGGCTGNTEDEKSKPCVLPNGIAQYHAVQKYAEAYVLAHKEAMSAQKEAATIPTQKKKGSGTVNFIALVTALGEIDKMAAQHPLDTESVVNRLNKVSHDLCGPDGACELKDPTPTIVTS